MRLSARQQAAYDRDGYLFFDRLFDADEVATLREAIPGVIAGGGEGVKHEAAGAAVRLVHGVHLTHPLLATLQRHPRLLRPAQQLLDDGVYTFQSRLVLKSGIGSEAHAGYPWHQDYCTWRDMDGMREPRALVFAVFLDDVTAANAPVLLVPGSHRDGVLCDRDAYDERSYRQIVIAPAKLAELVARNGLVAQLGAAGSVLLIHPNLVHASGPNISPLRRAFYYVIYNAVTNACTKTLRRPHHANPDVTPLVALDDDCLRAFQWSDGLAPVERLRAGSHGVAR